MNFRALHIARSSLLAHQTAVDITSGNIANVNTPSYTRRRAHLSSFVPEPGGMGAGVRVRLLAEFHHRYLELQLRGLLSRHSRSQADELLLRRLTALFGEAGQEPLADLFRRFFNAVADLVARPEDLSLRELLLQRAEELTASFRQLGADLRALRAELLQQLHEHVEEFNHLLQRVADVNAERAVTPEGSERALALADEQARLLGHLARLTPIVATVDARGMVTVSVAGHTVLAETTVLPLRLRTSRDATGEHRAELVPSLPGVRTPPALSIADGELGSLLEHYNVTLDPQEPSSGLSLPRELDAFVAQWVERVNAIVSRGYGLDDTVPPSPGRRLFEGESMETLRLSADVVGNPRVLPLADRPGEPGNAAIAQQLLALAELPAFGRGYTPQGFYTATVSRLGEVLATAQQRREWLQASLQQLEAQWQALSGVNLDEETANLIRYQKAYEAAARLATVAASLLDTLIRMGT